MYGTDDYLHQAADSANWPRTVGGIPFKGYGPNGDGKIIGSLGIHEHWNDSTHKQYSRNLDSINGKGIELVFLNQSSSPSPIKTVKANISDFSIYPNPVHLTSIVSYSLTATAKVEIQVISAEGKIIYTIVNQTQQPGEYKALFDATGIESGTYFCEFIVNEKNILTKQVEIIK
jgi:hypothetical protein